MEKLTALDQIWRCSCHPRFILLMCARKETTARASQGDDPSETQVQLLDNETVEQAHRLKRLAVAYVSTMERDNLVAGFNRIMKLSNKNSENRFALTRDICRLAREIINGKFHPALWQMLDVRFVVNHLIEKRPITGSASKNQLHF